MLDAVSNFAIATCTAFDASATTITLATGKGALFPTPTGFLNCFNLVVWNSTDYPNPASDPGVEIVRVTARSSDTLTVVRAQEGTSASAHNTSGKTYSVMLAPTKKLVDDLNYGRFFPQSPQNAFFLFDHFIGNASSQGQMLWQFQTTGTGAAADVIGGDSSHPGVCRLQTGTTTTGFAGYTTSRSLMTFGNGAAEFECWHQTYDLSSATDRHVCIVGFGDTAGAAEPTDGVYFIESDDINSGCWLGRSSRSGTKSDMDATGGTPVAVTNTWVRLRIMVNADGSEAQFFVNDVYVGKVATNIPASSSYTFGVQTYLWKTAGTTTARIFHDSVSAWKAIR